MMMEVKAKSNTTTAEEIAKRLGMAHDDTDESQCQPPLRIGGQNASSRESACKVHASA